MILTNPLHAPFNRNKLSTRVHFRLFPRIIPPAVNIKHGLMVCALAATIHDTDVAVRKAAYRMLKRTEDNYAHKAMAYIVLASRPRKMAFQLLDLEVPDPEPTKRKRKRKKKK